MKRLLIVLLLCAAPAWAADVGGLELGTRLSRAMIGSSANTCSAVNFNSVDSSDMQEVVFLSATDDTITSICALHSSRGAGDPGTHTLRLTDVNAADGHAGSTVHASCTVDPPASTAWNASLACCAISYDATAGEALAIQTECTSGCDAGNYSGWCASLPAFTAHSAMPYTWVRTNGTWAKGAYMPTFAYRTATNIYGNPISSMFGTAYDSADTPDEYGMAFSLPAAACSTYTIDAVTCNINGPASGSTAKMILSGGSLTPKEVTIDGDIYGGVLGATYKYPYRATFGPHVLNCGTRYYVSLQPQDASAATIFHSAIAAPGVNVTFTAGQAAAALEGAGTFFMVSRTDGGAWDESTYAAYRPVCSISVLDITAPTCVGACDAATLVDYMEANLRLTSDNFVPPFTAAASSTTTSVVATSASWPELTNQQVCFTSGALKDKCAQIAANDATSLTVDTLSAEPDGMGFYIAPAGSGSGGSSGSTGSVIMVNDGELEVYDGAISGVVTNSYKPSANGVELAGGFAPTVAVLSAARTGGTSLDVVLEHSYDRANWSTLATFTQVAGSTGYEEVPLAKSPHRYVRAKVTTVGVGSSWNLSASILGTKVKP